MIPEEIKKKMISLVEHGAVISLKDLGLEFNVGLAVWVGDDFYWCSWFPEDQHHFHISKIEFVKMHHHMFFEFISDNGHGCLSEFEYFAEFYEHWPRWVSVRDGYRQHLPKGRS